MAMIAEWEAQSRLLFSFPSRAGDWGLQLEAASRELADLIQAAARFVPVTVVCSDHQWAEPFAAGMETIHEVDWLPLPTNDSWIRDFGPLSTRRADGGVELHDFWFNGWGGKFEAELDNRLSARLWAARRLGHRHLIAHDWVLEGGSLETNGLGKLLTTERCLLNPNRNPGLKRSDIEKRLAEQLGLEQVYWLSRGELQGDDTDAHIDTLVRYIAPDRVLHVVSSHAADPHSQPLHEMELELKQLMPQVELVPVPLPSPVYDAGDGHRLPATYANFVLTNGAVLLPIYQVDTDQQAVDVLEQAFPDREVVPLSSRALVHQHGSFHCLSMNLYQDRINSSTEATG